MESTDPTLTPQATGCFGRKKAKAREPPKEEQHLEVLGDDWLKDIVSESNNAKASHKKQKSPERENLAPSPATSANCSTKQNETDNQRSKTPKKGKSGVNSPDATENEKRIELHQNVGFPPTLEPKKDDKGKPYFVFPENWNAKVRKEYSRGIWNVIVKGKRGICITIHLNDDDPAVKRHFLAFYGIPVHKLSLAEFTQWCYDASMFNSINDYLPLRIVSAQNGPGSIVLRSLHRQPGVIGIQMSDRFKCHTGMVRAIRFTALTRRQAVYICNFFLQSIKPSILTSTVISQEFPAVETDDPLMFQQALKSFEKRKV